MHERSPHVTTQLAHAVKLVAGPAFCNLVGSGWRWQPVAGLGQLHLLESNPLHPLLAPCRHKVVVLEAREKIGGRSERRHVTTTAGAEVPCNLPQCTKADGSVDSKWWWDLGGEWRASCLFHSSAEAACFCGRARQPR